MSIYSIFKRRVLYKCSPLLKKVVLPIAVVFFLLNAFAKTPERVTSVEEDLILPGEALDPLAKSKSRSHGNHAKNDLFAHPPELIKQGRDKAPSEQKFSLNAGIGIASPSDPGLNIIAPPIGVAKKVTKETRKQKNKDGFDDSDVPPRIETAWSMAKANIPDSDKVRFKPHAITNDTVTLTLMSSEDKVFMSINKKEIYRAINRRGLHVVVINQYSGRVMAKRVFDTFMEGVEEDMVEFLDDVTDGRIVVFAVLDEISKGLTWKGREKLREMGCRWSKKIAYRDMWGMVTRKGGMKIAETFSNVATADTGYEWGGPIFMRTDFDLEEKPVECHWPRNERNEARRLFCLRYEGYGALCRCDVKHWDDVFFTVDQKENERLKRNPLHTNTAIVIIATNRTHNLYRALKSLHEAPGLNTDMLAVYVESASREVRALTKLFGVILVESGNYKNRTITQKVRHKVQRVFRDVMGVKFESRVVPEGGLPDDVLPPFSAENILLLEEDLVVSIDIFKYLFAVAPILQKDRTILGISAFNYHGYRDVASDQTTFYRTSDPLPLAILLPSRTVKEILVPSWPTPEQEDKEWWSGFSKEMGNNKGDIVYPEVPRAKHCSFEGYLIKGSAQKNLFKEHILSLTTQYNILQEEIDRLELKKYKESVEKTIKESKKIEFDFCKHDLIYGQEPNAVFVSYDGSDDSHWGYVMKCLKTWSIYMIGGWRDVWQFHFHGRVLSVVGVPQSPFSYLKSANDVVMTSPPNTNSTTPKTI